MAKQDRALMDAAKSAGVEFHPVHIYAREPKQARGLVLGFAAFDEKSIRKAVRAWAAALRD